MQVGTVQSQVLRRARIAQRQADRIAVEIAEDVMRRVGRRALTIGEEFEVVRRLRRCMPGVTREQREAAIRKVIA